MSASLFAQSAARVERMPQAVPGRIVSYQSQQTTHEPLASDGVMMGYTSMGGDEIPEALAERFRAGLALGERRIPTHEYSMDADGTRTMHETFSDGSHVADPASPMPAAARARRLPIFGEIPDFMMGLLQDDADLDAPIVRSTLEPAEVRTSYFHDPPTTLETTNETTTQGEIVEQLKHLSDQVHILALRVDDMNARLGEMDGLATPNEAFMRAARRAR